MIKGNFLKTLAVVVGAIVVTSIFVKAVDYKQEENGLDECPLGMVFVPNPQGGFCIDRYEASANKNCPYKNPENQDKTRVNLNDADCYAVSQKDAIPWRFISQDQAKVACAKAGKSLLTNKQWLIASLGTIDLSKNWTESDCNVDKNWKENPGMTGSAENCVSIVGAYDMIGNVWEWVDAVSIDGKFENKILPNSGFVVSSDGVSLPGKTNLEMADENYNLDYFWTKKNDIRAMARGGYWNNGSDAGVYSVYNVVPPSYAGAGIGFRCAK